MNASKQKEQIDKIFSILDNESKEVSNQENFNLLFSLL
jgi:hypothetical protein